MCSERVFVLRSVRVLYEKKGRMKFISHLDMTRFMARLIRRAKLPVWYTEGFNPHLYLTFALPLPLGFISTCEMTEIRILDDSFDISSIPALLNSFCPEDIRFISCHEAVLKAGEIKSADFTVTFDDAGALTEPLGEFLQSGDITVIKKTKKGGEKPLSIGDRLRLISLGTNENGDTELKINLPAGGELNINPELVLSAFFESGKTDYYCYTVTRTAILDKSGKDFK